VPGLEEVLQRCADDPAFLAALQADPPGTLRGYVLSNDDLARLGALIDPHWPAPRSFVERSGSVE
jgi:hypothetical protein